MMDPKSKEFGESKQEEQKVKNRGDLWNLATIYNSPKAIGDVEKNPIANIYHETNCWVDGRYGDMEDTDDTE